MRPALLVIDVQNDYLAIGSLVPHRDGLCEAIEYLITNYRQAGAPVVHVWTTIESDDQGMPHWSAAGVRRCIAGSPGHATPERLRPLSGEQVIHKRYYSAFTNASLEEYLRSARVDTVVLAGIFLRACIRTTAIDAYSRGFQVVIGEEAVGESDPVHGVVTRDYLTTRIARFVGVDELCRAIAGSSLATPAAEASASTLLPVVLTDEIEAATVAVCAVDHLAPRNGDLLWRTPIGGQQQVAAAAQSARRALAGWQRQSPMLRAAVLGKVAERLAQNPSKWARQIAIETGKPIREARLEVNFALDLIRHGIRFAQAGDEPSGGTGWISRRRPLGVIGVITPWNNPLAIPLGKIVPAVMHGNTVVWKPAIPGAGIAVRVYRLLRECGLAGGVVNIVLGDLGTAQAVFEDPEIDGVALTGSSAAGYAAQVACCRRRIPLQAELGGNNAAIVWPDAEMDLAARQIALGGFGSAGQRCTANRRVVVEDSIHDQFIEALQNVMRDLFWGDPLDEATVVGPVISDAALRRIRGVVGRAHAAGAKIVVERIGPSGQQSLCESGYYYPPTLVCGAVPDSEVVQEETFGPVIVVQRAEDWKQAIELCNGVRQGLAAAVFCRSREIQQHFLEAARAGILKINSSTAGAVGDAPFGGWKESGIGPPEHGIGDNEFYCRHQTVYNTDLINLPDD
jgi:acyl-CoA reductase-like NAD-dependent aldehyde dehydrogenase/nicotinamidase-related amidase